MKLLHCTSCQDVVALHSKERSCLCGASKGKYVDELNVTYSGVSAIILGVRNTVFQGAIANHKFYGTGQDFNAFTIPNSCNTIKHVARIP